MECPRPPARPRQPAHHPVLSAPCAFPLKARYFLFRARPRLPARTYIFRRQRSGAAGPTSRSPPSSSSASFLPPSATFVVLQLQSETHAFLLKKDFPRPPAHCNLEFCMHVENYTYSVLVYVPCLPACLACRDAPCGSGARFCKK